MHAPLPLRAHSEFTPSLEMAMEPQPLIHFNEFREYSRLWSAQAHPGLNRLNDSLLSILNSPVLLDTLVFLQHLTRQAVQDMSHYGAVFYGGRQRRWVDLGNWSYACLYNCLYRRSSFRGDHVGVHSLLNALAAKWPSVELKAAPTTGSIELKGDIMEAVLAQCRLTGPAVATGVRDARISLNDKFKNWAAAMDELDHVITVDEVHEGATGSCSSCLVAARPWLAPDKFAKMFFFALAALQHAGPGTRREALRRDLECQFQQMVNQLRPRSFDSS